MNRMSKFAITDSIVLTASEDKQKIEEQTVFNASKIIEKLFAHGSRNGIRCVTEVSVYRQFKKMLKISEMCRHKIAFDMSAEDCSQYIGGRNSHKSIGQNAIYSDGGATVYKLIPYKLNNMEV